VYASYHAYHQSCEITKDEDKHTTTVQGVKRPEVHPIMDSVREGTTTRVAALSLLGGGGVTVLMATALDWSLLRGW
jgi:hypothetical protein